MYFYDYETTFLAKGHKREEQQLLEVGIVRGRKGVQGARGSGAGVLYYTSPY